MQYQPISLPCSLLRRVLVSTIGMLAAIITVVPESRVHADVPFEFKQDDVVAIFGNGLADRMQHDPWIETLLQVNLEGKNVRFRNMSFSGDVVNKRPRDQGFTNDTEYLQHVAPSVVWIMYGYNESHAGPDGATAYQKELVKLVNEYRALRKEAGVEARFVLFSPIAYENTGNRDLPDGKELNTNLSAYTNATKEAAAAAEATFVDLFTPTLKLYEITEEPLTLNGIHLNAKGYRKLADVIAERLLGKSVAARESMSLVYDAVTDKNWHWHNRFRATDGNDIWGSRSTLSFVDGQTNAEVLVHELKMLDLMTANRDVVIWAAAGGKSIKPDDSNVPAPLEVKSNVGGGSRSSSAEKEGNSDYLSPEESLKQIRVPDGFELNVFASEVMFPDLANPVQLQVDGKGRLWVASWNSYPKWEPGHELKDSLMILEDTDGDGVADERKIFAHVHNPLGFEFWGGGVLVTSGPDLLFLKDTDGDDKADVRYPILQGLGTSDTHHAANNLIYGPDGGIYWQSGIFLVHNHETPWKQNLNTGGSGMYRFDPRTFAITPVAANSPNPHGTSFDRWGYLYANDGTGGKSYQVRPKDDGFQMHSLLEKEFRPVPANEILSSAHFPEDMQQDFLVLNVIGFLGVKQYDLNRGDGVTRQYGNVWGTPVQELLSGDDRNFRPSDAIVGEDGALYVADWHNMIIGHMQHNIRDPSRDHQHGRILRLTAKDRPLQEPVAIHGQSIEKLLENLKHPVDGVRHRSRVELSTHDSDAVIAAAQAWAKDFDPNDETEAHHLLEALWLHQQHNVTNNELLNKLLSSTVPHAAIAAKTVEHFWTKFDTKLASDFAAAPESHIVKYNPPKHLDRQLRDAYKRGSEIFQREAHCATCHQTNGLGNGAVYPPLVGSPWVTGSEDRLVKLALHGMWGKMQVGGKIYDPTRGVPPMTAFRDLLNDKEMADVLTFVRNTWGNKASAIEAATVAKVRAASSDRSTFWKPEELEALHPLEKELMSKEDLQAPEVVNNIELEKELLAQSLQDLAAIAEKNGNLQRGKQLFYTSAAACFACHDPPGNAPKLGPDLTKISRPMKPEDWVSGVLYPSRHIEKEFAQVNVLTLEGKVLSGIRISEDDKGIVLRNVADPKPITIPADSIEDLVESKQSMMPDGLVRTLNNRQEFDDLMKYLISLQAKEPVKVKAKAKEVVYKGVSGVGAGKHVVFLAGDHEYRSEETLPALARILAKHHGFKCTVLFNVDKETGEVAPGNSNMPGMEALDTADLAVVFLRFQDFPVEQMRHLDEYLNRGGAVVGLRTATHAFKIKAGEPFGKYSFDYKGDDYELGFGHQVLGQTWVGHYGKNHQQSTRITIIEGKESHPILRGVKDVWVQAGGYVGKPTDGEVLTMAQPLNGMTPDSPVDETKPPQPSEWTRTYKSKSGETGRVLTSLYGTPEDLLNDGYRRLLVNGCFWALGLEDAIKPDANIHFVGPFEPNTFGNGSHARGIKPEVYAGFESPIPANHNTQKPDAPASKKAPRKKDNAKAKPADASTTP